MQAGTLTTSLSDKVTSLYIKYLVLSLSFFFSFENYLPCLLVM